MKLFPIKSLYCIDEYDEIPTNTWHCMDKLVIYQFHFLYQMDKHTMKI